MLRIILVVLCCTIPTFPQSLDKYSYRREVTIQTLKGNKVTSTLVRKSFFTFSDAGQKTETEVQVSGKSKLELTEFDWRTFRDPQIVSNWWAYAANWQNPTGDIWTNEALRATTWKSADIVDHDAGELRFPVNAQAEGLFKGKHVRLSVKYSNYRLFRTSVVVREVSE